LKPEKAICWLHHKFLPILSKDQIKETLFDSLGYSDRDWSQKLGGASFDLMYLLIEKMSQAGTNFVVDAYFSNSARASETFAKLVECCALQTLLIRLSCHGEALIERFKKRNTEGSRHPGHVDESNWLEFNDTLLQGHCQDLVFAEKQISVDTTDIKSLSDHNVLLAIEDWFKE